MDPRRPGRSGGSPDGPSGNPYGRGERPRQWRYGRQWRGKWQRPRRQPREREREPRFERERVPGGQRKWRLPEQRLPTEWRKLPRGRRERLRPRQRPRPRRRRRRARQRPPRWARPPRGAPGRPRLAAAGPGRERRILAAAGRAWPVAGSALAASAGDGSAGAGRDRCERPAAAQPLDAPQGEPAGGSARGSTRGMTPRDRLAARLGTGAAASGYGGTGQYGPGGAVGRPPAGQWQPPDQRVRNGGGNGGGWGGNGRRGGGPGGGGGPGRVPRKGDWWRHWSFKKALLAACATGAGFSSCSWC